MNMLQFRADKYLSNILCKYEYKFNEYKFNCHLQRYLWKLMTSVKLNLLVNEIEIWKLINSENTI